MTTRHLSISKEQHRGVPRSISIVKLVSRILRHNHWGCGHVVEICKPPQCAGAASPPPCAEVPELGQSNCWASTAISGGVLACGDEPLQTQR